MFDNNKMILTVLASATLVIASGCGESSDSMSPTTVATPATTDTTPPTTDTTSPTTDNTSPTTDTTSPPAGSLVASYGRIQLTELDSGLFGQGNTSVSAMAHFEKRTPPQPLSFEEDFWLRPELDRCTIDEPPSEAPSVDRISAGEVIVLSSEAGTFLELDTSRLGNMYLSGSLPGPIPSRITGNIPGDEFPAFDEFEMPFVQSLEVLFPATTEQAASTRNFSWVPDADADNYLWITGLVDGGGSFLCWVVDDGSFDLPSGVADGLALSGVSLIRMKSTFITRGDTLLHLWMNKQVSFF